MVAAFGPAGLSNWATPYTHDPVSSGVIDAWQLPLLSLVHDHGERIIVALGKVKLATLKPGQVEAFLRQMAAAGLSTSTIAQTRRVLIKAIRRAERDGLVSRNAAHLADCPAGTRRQSRSMTEA